MVHTVFFGQLICWKIITIVATRGQILRLKCTKFCFGWGSAPHTLPGLAGCKGSTFKRREGMCGNARERGSAPHTLPWLAGCKGSTFKRREGCAGT